MQWIAQFLASQILQIDNLIVAKLNLKNILLFQHFNRHLFY